MRILYLHQYFNTPKEPGGTRSYWISRKLIQHNHEVIMLTSKSNLESPKEEVEVDGITVIYLKVSYNQNMGVFLRFIAFFKYMIKSLVLVIKLRNKYDKIYATSTPLSIGIPALFAKKMLGKSYLFEVRDLWPEVPIQIGAIKNRLLIEVLKIIENTIYKYAETIVALSPGMYDGVLSTGINPKKVHMIPNMAKPNEFYPREKNKSIMHEFQIKNNQITIIYFGAIGKSNGLSDFLEKFKVLKCNEFRLLIAGEGSEKTALQKYVKDENIFNVQFVGNYPMSKISDLVNCCDISLVSFLDIPILHTNSPNKFFDSLSAGKPIIVNSSGWTKDLVEKYNCGFYYDPKSLESFISMFGYIKENINILEQMGLNGRKLSINTFDKDLLTDQIVSLI